jgi:hypothetical protein
VSGLVGLILEIAEYGPGTTAAVVLERLSGVYLPRHHLRELSPAR